MERIKNFFKKWWKVISLPIGVLLGFFTARYTSRGTRDDIADLRRINEQLRSQLEELRSETRQLIRRAEESGRECAELRERLRRADELTEEISGDIDSVGDDTERLRENNNKLREWIEKYGKEDREAEDN